MLSTKKKTLPNPSSKDMLLKEAAAIISEALESYKERLGEKKFEKRILKAAKLITHGLKTVVEDKKVAKKAASKTTKKSPEAAAAKPKTSSPKKVAAVRKKTVSKK